MYRYEYEREKPRNRFIKNYSYVLNSHSPCFAPWGGMENTEQSYILTGLLEIITVCAVNCYAMISGFVGYRENNESFFVRLKKYILMWLQVVSYSFGVTLLIYIAKFPNLSTKYLIGGLFPVTSGYYWYFTAYTGLFFTIPLINTAIKRMNQTEFFRVGLVCLLVIPTYSQVAVWFMKNDVFYLNGGYSYLWLVILYVIGAWVKQANIAEKLETWQVCLIWGSCLIITYLFHIMSGSRFCLSSYISPTVVLMAFSLMLGSLKLGNRIKNNRFIFFFGSATFGIYLLHENNLIRKYFISGRFVWVSKLSPVGATVAVIGVAIVIFVVCLVIEKLRNRVFTMLHIQELIMKIGVKERKSR